MTKCHIVNCQTRIDNVTPPPDSIATAAIESAVNRDAAVNGILMCNAMNIVACRGP